MTYNLTIVSCTYLEKISTTGHCQLQLLCDATITDHYSVNSKEGEVVYFNAGFTGQAKMPLRQCLLWRPENYSMISC